ncbi:MAG: transposase [Bacteroidetes bacterium]|nr:MAG: transposase [Bacteroidota bacterium]TAF93927.1 MAG: transposase [Bacteroidota bacterium]
MPTGGYQIKDQNAIHFITFSVIEWVDVFTRTEYADIVVQSLQYCQQNKGLDIHAWVLMSNHIHLLISAKADYYLSDILRDFKKFTSAKIIQAIEANPRESRRNWMLWIFKTAGKRNKRNEQYQFWQQENHPIECSTAEVLSTKKKYIHENPLRAGLVRNEWDFVYSSAIDYYLSKNGLLEIDSV